MNTFVEAEIRKGCSELGCMGVTMVISLPFYLPYCLVHARTVEDEMIPLVDLFSEVWQAGRDSAILDTNPW